MNTTEILGKFLELDATTIAVIGFGVFQIVRVIMKKVKIKKLKVAGIEFELDEKGNKVPKKGLTDVDKKIIALEVSTSITKLLLLQSEKDKIENVSKFRSQMKYADIKAEELKNLMYKHFLVQLKEKQNSKDNLITNKTTINYKTTLELVMSDTLITLRRAFKENGLADMSEAKFESYTKTLIEQLSNQASEILDTNFASDVITREELYDHNNALRPNIVAIVSTAIREARTIAIEAKKRTTEIDIEIKKILEQTEEEILDDDEELETVD